MILLLAEELNIINAVEIPVLPSLRMASPLCRGNCHPEFGIYYHHAFLNTLDT